MPTPVPGPDLTHSFILVISAMLAICLAALFLIKWVFPKLIRAPFSRKGGPIRILGRFALEPRQAIYVIKIGKKTLVLGTSERGLSSLTTLESAELPDEWKEEEKV